MVDVELTREKDARIKAEKWNRALQCDLERESIARQKAESELGAARERIQQLEYQLGEQVEKEEEECDSQEEDTDVLSSEEEEESCGEGNCEGEIVALLPSKQYIE